MMTVWLHLLSMAIGRYRVGKERKKRAVVDSNAELCHTARRSFTAASFH